MIHGPPRSSKSTLALQIAYDVYKDWNKVLDSIVFNLPTLISKIKNGKPVRYPTINGQHNRVPLIVYDDFGVHSNKADTQHSSAWDIFKGGFDCIGTELGVLLATMVSAEEATSQLQNKYNAEITVKTKGQYKYDKVEWLQDYTGFRRRMKKIWVESGTFEPIPKEVYAKYDVMRRELTKEVFVRIEDALSNDNIDFLLRLVKPEDIQLLKLIDQKGPVAYEKTMEDVITRCRSRNLILTVSTAGKHVKYELSRLGKDLLVTVDADERTKAKIAARNKHKY